MNSENNEFMRLVGKTLANHVLSHIERKRLILEAYDMIIGDVPHSVAEKNASVMCAALGEL